MSLFNTIFRFFNAFIYLLIFKHFTHSDTQTLTEHTTP
jgi:hypothetical protein